MLILKKLNLIELLSQVIFDEQNAAHAHEDKILKVGIINKPTHESSSAMEEERSFNSSIVCNEINFSFD